MMRNLWLCVVSIAVLATGCKGWNDFWDNVYPHGSGNASGSGSGSGGPVNDKGALAMQKSITSHIPGWNVCTGYNNTSGLGVTPAEGGSPVPVPQSADLTLTGNGGNQGINHGNGNRNLRLSLVDLLAIADQIDQKKYTTCDGSDGPSDMGGFGHHGEQVGAAPQVIETAPLVVAERDGAGGGTDGVGDAGAGGAGGAAEEDEEHRTAMDHLPAEVVQETAPTIKPQVFGSAGGGDLKSERDAILTFVKDRVSGQCSRTCEGDYNECSGDGRAFGGGIPCKIGSDTPQTFTTKYGRNWCVSSFCPAMRNIVAGWQK